VNLYPVRKFPVMELIILKDNQKVIMKADINLTVRSEAPNVLPGDHLAKQILFRTEPVG
jgi:hypothetical protein